MIILQLDSTELQAIVTNAVKKAIEERQKIIPEKAVEEYEDIQEASKTLKKAVRTIYSLASRRILPSYKRGKKLYFKKSELLNWVQSGRRQPASEIQLRARNFK